MQKFVFSCCFGLIFFLNGFCNGLYAEETESFYKISIQDREASFAICLKTAAIYQKARYLKTDALELELPEGNGLGSISAQLEVDALAPSIEISGPLLKI